ncbi:MAG: DUF362 domain-containing protein [Deltaproteobacteria bacterium]|nr:MAG: DUF362 domain-containing protein [Deltaproteobacteria bacterium]
MAKVALIRCESYHYDTVKSSIARGIDLLGGPEKFAKKGEKVLLKPNLLAAEPPRKYVTTHPTVFRAVAEVLMSTGAVVSYGDAPALGNISGTIKKTGFKEIASTLGVELADFKSGQEVFFKDGRQNKKFIVAKGLLESDGIISLPKLKTHGLERLTGCVKNQFGCVPGLLKGEYHVKLADANDFAKMLVDLNRFINPRLYIMDGIWGMEGNGPRGGTPKKLNILLFSKDPIALDATVCRLIDLKPEYVPTIRFGMEFGAGTYRESEIELVGDNLNGFKPLSFKVERTPVKPFEMKGIRRLINNRLVPKPFINAGQCIQCGVCVSVCPATPKAVNWFDGDKSKPPIYHYNDCIRCYCCQEMCPEGAISLKVPLIRKIFDFFMRQP